MKYLHNEVREEEGGVVSDLTRQNPHANTSAADALELLADEIELKLANEDYDAATEAINRDLAASWFALRPWRAIEIIQLLGSKSSSPPPLMKAARKCWLKILEERSAHLQYGQTSR